MAEKRGRAWSFIGYPGDSLPKDYAEILTDEMHLQWAESPVHDADLNGDGSEKKPHIHFLIVFEGNKSFEQVKEITDRLNAPIPQKCMNPRGLVRYFIHLDNPDKTQYKKDDIKTHGGIAIDEYFKRSKAETGEIVREILQFCLDNDLTEFSDLVEAAFAMENADWIDVLTTRNTVFFSAYLKSRHFKKQDEVRQSREALRELGNAYNAKGKVQDEPV